MGQRWSKAAWRGMQVVSWVMLVIGLFLVLAGGWLWWLGGSFFYLPCGVLIMVSGVLLLLRSELGAGLLLWVVVATWTWAYLESDGTFWSLLPRVFLVQALAALVFLLLPGAGLSRHPRRSLFAGGLSVLLCAGFLAGTLIPHFAVVATQPLPRGHRVTASGPVDWRWYGGDAAGHREVAATQIDPANVGRLREVWRVHTGDVARNGAEDQNTPLAVDGTVYACTPHGKVLALDADTGMTRWTFDPRGSAPFWQRCRSLGHADLRQDRIHAVAYAGARCTTRIYLGTGDNRLIALDARDGHPCDDFGTAGVVDLRAGMGQVKPGYYMPTTGPLVVENGLVILGGWVVDNQEVDEPSGVVRAFDAVTGRLAWAWDPGNPLRKPGEPYTRATPNVWAPMSYDAKLGLVYLPTGNTTPDFWGGERTSVDDAYSSSVVALDYRSGREAWHMQTVHHDLWDYDVPAQPLLAEVPGPQGPVPALVQVTKRGQIFLLDRKTGEAIAPVVERSVPIEPAAAGERVSLTQPYSVGMPAIGAEPLAEDRMWGMTMLDQLVCRIAFRALQYQGDFTPTTTRPTLQYPSNAGGMNWGGATLDRASGYLVVNDVRIPLVNRLIPRDETARYAGNGTGHGGYSAQRGTPFGLVQHYFLSPLGVPCNTPPYGTLSAIDLSTRQIVWQRPLGTTEDTRLFGMRTGVPMQLGMPGLGGSLATASGLLFYSGTQDYYLRAFSLRDGTELWKCRLPVGGQSTPMSYVSPKTGRQYIVLTASGARDQPDRGDNIIAYALPDR